MKNNLLYIILICSLLSCTQKSVNKNNRRLELAKWTMYSLNYQDTFTENEMKVIPIECNLKLAMSHESKDRATYCFDFYYKDTSNRCYLPSGIDCIVIRYDTLVDVIFHQAIPSDTSLNELLRLNREYIKPRDSLFREYLKLNKNNAIDWLKKQLDI